MDHVHTKPILSGNKLSTSLVSNENFVVRFLFFSLEYISYNSVGET